MKILLTGGGTGGHVYPLIAIAEELNKIADEERLVNFRLYYMADKPYVPELLEQQFITYIPITAGKLRVYFSFQNFVDVFKTFFGTIGAIIKVFNLFPDVVISKGGYVSFPVLFAARLLRIPVIIHESDTVPGRVNKWAGKFAQKVALSFPEAAEFFDKEKVAITGQPVRHSIISAAKEGARQFFELEDLAPVIGIVGGSSGAKVINECIEQILPQLLEKYQVLHQTGPKNYDEMKTDVSVILAKNDSKRLRYHIYPYFNDVQTKMFGGACDIIISRSGSMLFEIAAWGKPSILIPYAIAHGDHQRKNAYHYARTGACVVIEEANLTSSVLYNEIDMILSNKQKYKTMSEHAQHFFNSDAARLIAAEAVRIALKHEE